MQLKAQTRYVHARDHVDVIFILQVQEFISIFNCLYLNGLQHKSIHGSQQIENRTVTIMNEYKMIEGLEDENPSHSFIIMLSI